MSIMHARLLHMRDCELWPLPAGLRKGKNRSLRMCAHTRRSVSICAPAFYAHLAAKRARLMISTEYADSGSEASLPGGGGGGGNPLTSIHGNLLNRLYFM